MPFYFWTVILGMVVGASLTWFLVADHPFESREAPGGPVDDLEAETLAAQLHDEGTEMDEATVARVLELHGSYVVGERTARPYVRPGAIEADEPAEADGPAEPSVQADSKDSEQTKA
jgi:hypothetical protein